jgi:O-antigen/teichoic acid export membrane protein
MSQILAKLPNIFKDHLYRNSMFLVLSRLLNATAGFLFWVIAAKLYSITEVGTATALISSLGLIMLFSRFGFDLSLIRYGVNADKNKVFNTSLVITSIAATIISLIYILGINFLQISPSLNLSYGMLFILIAILNSIALITGNMFLALRKGQYFFIQTVLICLRVFLLFPLANLKSFGIFLALGTCYVLSFIFSLWILHKEVKINFLEIDRPFIKESFKFSIGSFISNILMEAPILILPIMVLHLLGQAQTAIYYIAMTIGNLALIVPYALSVSLFVEGSHGQPLKQNIFRACTTAYLFLIPIIVIISLWGKNILALISQEYVEAYELLFLVIIASSFAVIYMVFISVQNIKMRVERNIRFNLLRFVLLLGTSYYLIPKYNINGVGYAWLLTHVILTLVIAATLLKAGLMKILGQRKVECIEGDEIAMLTLTTGPVVRDHRAYNLVVIILNTTCLNLKVKVVVNDLTEDRKQNTVNLLLIQGNFTESLILPKPPKLYEVLIEGVPPGVYVWTSTSKEGSGPSLHKRKFIASNTYRHNDFISVPNI